ncbi:MAG: hypothetical protein QOD74_1985 [Variibacter sp.]|nr:hypothetical protein [Variibacter sp.]
MRLLLGLIYTFALAGFIGLGATWLAVTHSVAFGGLRLSAWTAHPKNGTQDIDPYARAAIARSGELPIGSGDGIAFSAHTDDTKRLLDGRCNVSVVGITPAARLWTLTLYDPEGNLVANAVNRYGFTSQELVRRSDGSFEISVGPRARPGNWLPTGGAERYVLILRLYDSPFGVATRAGRETTMPSVTTGQCT